MLTGRAEGVAKLRWDRIMEDINGGANDAWLKKRYGLGGDTVAVYRKYAKYMRFSGDGTYVDCVSAEAISAMASFNQLAYTLDMF